MCSSCRWNLLIHTSSLLFLLCSWCVIVIAVFVIVVYLFSKLSSLSSTVAVVAFFYYSCLFAVVVHIAVITHIAAIVIYVLLPLLPLSFVIYAWHSSARLYIEISGWCLNEIELPAVGPVEWFPTQLEIRLSCLTQS